MSRVRCVVAVAAAAALAGCGAGGEASPPEGRVTVSLPARGVDREALDEALRKAHVRATVREDAERPDVRVARDDGSAATTVGWDEELAGRLQAQGLADCLGALEGQRVARVGTPTAQQRLGQTFVLEPLLEQDVLRRAGDLREADAVLAADDAAAAAALRPAGASTVVVGRGATTAGVRNIVAGRQCLTLFAAPERLARAAAAAAVALAEGEPAPRHPPRLAPAVVVRDNVADFAGEAGFPRRDDVCAGALATACRTLGL